ncbi:TylF/MycF/NovP-related O-methyltransferase [Coleofasciculus sp.]|uniref:TylF/MycF/NovP-related O-methyltransferase n=1 Tax=Coleofasciculus sp. TaxID=3100458 RepID=UPI003A377E49
MDGNHLYEFVKKDLETYYPKVKTGGYITGDDYGATQKWWEDGVKKAVDEFRSQSLCKTVLIQAGQFILEKL